MKQKLKSLAKAITYKVLKLALIGIVVISGWEYVDETVKSYVPDFSTVENVSASTTPTTTEKEERIQAIKASEEAERVMDVWAEKKWIEEQEAVLEASKEKLRGEELGF